ncbi:helix-turn-helix domain-containing protein [Martelella endophytica]|uniref:helix-turn-helix domain-containing protein n=1 Tax=Martelella endophytica TaxID=1486262 RepID=UPI000AA3896E|nr:helix-turn-helix domain-containing protein [Martelella endophytica]
MANSKIGITGVERTPTELQFAISHPQPMAAPHWHAQVEVNYVFEGHVRYLMEGCDMRLGAGDLCLFWGGRAHRMDVSSPDSRYAVVHLPLFHFFRLNLPQGIAAALMRGGCLVTAATDAADPANFERWNRMIATADPERRDHAVNELLLRLQRIRFDAYALTGTTTEPEAHSVDDAFQSQSKVARMCDYISARFQEDIDSAAIAAAVGLHPKYAMSLFRKCTGLTINRYVNLLRVSYTQALLLEDGANVTDAAMRAGFGSLSAFNKCFREISGMSPSDFRRTRTAPFEDGNKSFTTLSPPLATAHGRC